MVAELVELDVDSALEKTDAVDEDAEDRIEGGQVDLLRCNPATYV